MRRLAILLLAGALAGCNRSSDLPHRTPTVAPEQQAELAAEIAANPQNWVNGLPTDRIVESWQRCRELKTPCAGIPVALQSIADAVASCRNNDTAFCAAVRTIPNHPIGKLLPPAKTPVHLPDTPFYWGQLHTGNALIDTLTAEKIDYRRDVLAVWWARWRIVFVAALGTALAGMGLVWLQGHLRRIRAEMAALNEREQQQREQRERAQRERDRQQREAWDRRAAATRQRLTLNEADHPAAERTPPNEITRPSEEWLNHNEADQQAQADRAAKEAARIEAEEQARRAAETAARIKAEEEARHAAEEAERIEAERQRAIADQMAQDLIETIQESGSSKKKKKR